MFAAALMKCITLGSPKYLNNMQAAISNMQVIDGLAKNMSACLCVLFGLGLGFFFFHGLGSS